MFQGLSAWFSTSTDGKIRQAWKDNGGTLITFETAQFIFSSDNACPDTERIYTSQEYVNEHLAVFHSSYVTDCVQAGSKEKVILGKYFLPPADIAEFVKKQLNFCWDSQLTTTQTPANSSFSAESSCSVTEGARCGKISRSDQAATVTSPASGSKRPLKSSAQRQASSSSCQASESSLSGSRISSRKNEDSSLKVQQTPKTRCLSAGRKRRTESTPSLHHSPSKSLRGQGTSDSQDFTREKRIGNPEESQMIGPSRRQRQEIEHRNAERVQQERVVVSADVHISVSGERQDQQLQRIDKTNNNKGAKPVVSSRSDPEEEELGVHEMSEENLSILCPRTVSGLFSPHKLEVINIKDLPKVTGVLEDFIPGEDGCEVYIRH